MSYGFTITLSSLSNIILQKASNIKEESLCGKPSEKWGKKIVLLNEQGSVPY
jgi:hypothetical protein